MGTDGLSAEQVLIRTRDLLVDWERCAYIFADLYWIDQQRPPGERMSAHAWSEPAEWLMWPATWLFSLYEPWTRDLEGTFQSRDARPVLESFWRMEVVHDHLDGIVRGFHDGTYPGLESLQKTILLLETYAEETDGVLNRRFSTVGRDIPAMELDADAAEMELRARRRREFQQALATGADDLDQRIRLSLRWVLTRLLDPALRQQGDPDDLQGQLRQFLNSPTASSTWTTDWKPILKGQRPYVYEAAA